MKIKTWIEKITDDSNLWLSAVKHEEERNYVDAITLYLKNATNELNQNSLVTVALDCVCAGNCAKEMNYFQLSKKLYHQAGKLYEFHHKKMLSDSPNESLWSLLQAYDVYLITEDFVNSQRVSSEYRSLMHRINPFYGNNEADDVLFSHQTNVLPMFVKNDSTPVPKQLAYDIEQFLHDCSLIIGDYSDSNYLQNYGVSYIE